MGILAAAALAVRPTYHTTKGKSPGWIVFGRDMIPPINHVTDWIYMCQRKQAEIDTDVIRENTTRIDHYYRVGDKVMTQPNSEFKYKSPYRGP